MEPGFIILLVLVVPFVILWPALIWAGAIASIYSVVRNRMRQRAALHQKQIADK